jgi:hypothetical protein
VESAEQECPPGHAETLRAMTTLALRKVPARGVFDPTVNDEDALFAAIDAIATAHLALAEARRRWRKALANAGLDVDRRDGIEQAALEVQTVSDTAYFYAGLGFGLAYAYVNGRG